MSELRRYRRNAAALITAVRLDLDTVGFTYRKWDGDQVCKPGDWLVDNIRDVYTVDQETLAKAPKRDGDMCSEGSSLNVC